MIFNFKSLFKKGYQMEKLEFIYKLEGNFDSNQGLDAEILSEILYGFAQLVTHANQVIFPEQENLMVKIRPFKTGSFVIEFNLFYEKVTQYLFAPGRVEHIKDLLVWLGLGTTCVTGLIKLINFLQGKFKGYKENSDGTYRYKKNNDEYIDVPSQTHALFNNCAIQKVIINAFVKPFDMKEVDSIEAYINESDKTILSKEDAENIEKYSKLDLSQLPLKNINIIDCELLIKKVDFLGKSQWELIYNKVINATIADKEFLAKVRHSEILISGGYRLSCKLQIITEVNEFMDILNVNYTVLKVHEVLLPIKQENIF